MRNYRFNDGPQAANPQQLPQVLTNQNQTQDGAFNPKTGNRDFFWFAHAKISIAAAANATSTILLDADGDFYCVAMSYWADIAAAAVTDSGWIIPLVTVQLTDSGSGYALMNTPIPIGSFMGDGKRPYRLIRPRVFSAQAQIQFSFNNFSVATTYNLQVILHGYKIRLGG
ncbi:MAG TPA: hypothetical protein VET48_04860 [Steroidobacteraceae bacterium]|nr:hypothetical protein [Steroidobacteraceae bacterium]